MKIIKRSELPEYIHLGDITYEELGSDNGFEFKERDEYLQVRAENSHGLPESQIVKYNKLTDSFSFGSGAVIIGFQFDPENPHIYIL